ncbi:hypothetical protein [Salinactinospora qingdaonensis]|uniref:SPW repeat-containing protein n=1 Tax=Salinactinospora qingdaonensis TaxID=702744 RepID=A0ABP7EVM5_9ACTN
MDLLTSWLAGIAAWLVLNTIGSVVIVEYAPAEQLQNFASSVAWNGTAGFIAYLLTAVVAALVHRRPERQRLGRNALAALGAPVVGTLGNAAVLLFTPGAQWGVFWSWSVIALAGAVVGWLLTRWMRA